MLEVTEEQQRFENIIMALDTAETMIAAIDKYGYTQVTADLFNLREVSTLFSPNELPSNESLSHYLEYPTHDTTTMYVLDKLVAGMEKLKTSANANILISDKHIEELANTHKIIEAVLKDIDTKGIDLEKAGTVKLYAPDYSKIQTLLRTISKILIAEAPKMTKRVTAAERLVKFGVDISSHIVEYNKLVDEYAQWEEKTFYGKIAGGLSFAKISDYVKKTYLMPVVRTEKEEILRTSAWFKNYRQAYRVTLDIYPFLLRYNKVLRSEQTRLKGILTFWRPNRVKTKFDNRYKQSMGWLIRMISYDINYYSCLCGLIWLYIHVYMSIFNWNMKSCIKK